MNIINSCHLYQLLRYYNLYINFSVVTSKLVKIAFYTNSNKSSNLLIIKSPLVFKPIVKHPVALPAL